MPKGPRKLRVAFGTATLTHYGGVYLLHRFLSRTGFKHAVAQDLRLVERNNRYSMGEMVLALLYPMILGLERIGNDSTSATERRLSVPHWTAKLSRRYDAAALLAACCPDRAAEAPRFA